MQWCAALLVLAGCGRIGFDSLTPGSGGDDTVGDGRLADGVTGDGVTGGPQLVDSGHMESGSTNQLSVILTNGVMVGDVIIASVGFRDGTTNISSLGDNRGNTYVREMQTNRTNGMVSQECPIAIAATDAASVQVTVNFSAAANQPSLRVLVYRGVDTSQAIEAQSSGGANIQNMSAATFVFKAGSKLVGTNTSDRASNPGTGFSLIMTTFFNDIVEERVAPGTGIQSVTGSLSTAGNWVMEAIALPPL